MLNYLQAWRERGWHPITADDYSKAWHRWGGSVATHPEIIQKISDVVKVDTRYLGIYKNLRLEAAVPAWGNYIALSKDALIPLGKASYYDLGKSEVIIPKAPDLKIRLPKKTKYISNIHQGHIKGLKPHKRGLGFTFAPHEFNRKFRSNQRRQRRMLQENNGEILPVSGLAPHRIAHIYTSLFEKRWGFETPAKKHLTDVFRLLQKFLTGFYITINDKPVAIQIVYRVESPNWISVEYINDGIDPDYHGLGLGSLLSYTCLEYQWDYASKRNKQLRSSFGSASSDYKFKWCHVAPIYRNY